MQPVTTHDDDADGPGTEEPAVDAADVDWAGLEPLAFAAARRVLQRNTAPLEEVVQSAFAKLLAAVRRGRVVNPFGLVVTVAHNEAVNYLRREDRHRRWTTGADHEVAAAAHATEVAARVEDTAVGLVEVARLLAELFDAGGLDDEQRHVIVAVHLREADLLDVAETLGRALDEVVELLEGAERQMLRGAGLTDRQAQAVTMVVLQGWTNDGAARVLGIRANTFAVRLKDGRQKLSAWLARHGGHP